jgi:hypothetical protein
MRDPQPGAIADYDARTRLIRGALPGSPVGAHEVGHDLQYYRIGDRAGHRWANGIDSLYSRRIPGYTEISPPMKKFIVSESLADWLASFPRVFGSTNKNTLLGSEWGISQMAGYPSERIRQTAQTLNRTGIRPWTPITDANLTSPPSATSLAEILARAGVRIQNSYPEAARAGINLLHLPPVSKTIASNLARSAGDLYLIDLPHMLKPIAAELSSKISPEMFARIAAGLKTAFRTIPK